MEHLFLKKKKNQKKEHRRNVLAPLLKDDEPSFFFVRWIRCHRWWSISTGPSPSRRRSRSARRSWPTSSRSWRATSRCAPTWPPSRAKSTSSPCSSPCRASTTIESERETVFFSFFFSSRFCRLSQFFRDDILGVTIRLFAVALVPRLLKIISQQLAIQLNARQSFNDRLWRLGAPLDST